MGGGLDGLLDDDMLGGVEEAPKEPTVDDMKAAFTGLIQNPKIGKDKGKAFVVKILSKLGVKGMGEIPGERRQEFIDVLNKTNASKK